LSLTKFNIYCENLLLNPCKDYLTAYPGFLGYILRIFLRFSFTPSCWQIHRPKSLITFQLFVLRLRFVYQLVFCFKFNFMLAAWHVCVGPKWVAVKRDSGSEREIGYQVNLCRIAATFIIPWWQFVELKINFPEMLELLNILLLVVYLIYCWKLAYISKILFTYTF